MTKDDFESLVGRFIGQTIAEVLYFDFGIPDIEEPWGQPWGGESPISGRIGDGAELRMMSGDVFWVTYGSEFFHYGVSLQFNPDELHWRQEDHYVSVDVSDATCWSSTVGHAITDAEVFWSEIVNESGEGSRIEYPQDVGLKFESESRLYFSALEFMSDGTLSYFADEIQVFCSEEELRKYAIGPYGTSS